MPRAIVELSHAMPDTTLIPFAVVGDKWRDEPWWTSGATLRLLLSEYAKYVAAELRVRLARRARRTGRQRRRSTSVKSIHRRISPAVTIVSRIPALLVP
jgi:hypothetical protein